MSNRKKLLTYSIATILLSAVASFPAMAEFEYDEPRNETERIHLSIV